VRSADDLADVLDIPQLGTITSALGTIKAISIGARA
jgi:hypothetical protein